MQVTLDKQYPVAAGVDAAWRVLSDMHELAGCMPGAQITDTIDATHYKGSVRVKVGPAAAAFAGDIEVLAIDPATHTLRILGKGADKGGSSASMELTAALLAGAGGASTLQGKADVIVNGKFAQFGGRMMTSVSDVILKQFADTFSQKAKALEAAPSGPPEPALDTPHAPHMPDAPHANAAPFSSTTPSAQASLADAADPIQKVPAGTARSTPPAPAQLNGLALMWNVLRHFLAGLFGRKT